MRSRFSIIGMAVIAALALIASPAGASLSTFQTFTGNVAASTDGCGSTAQTCTVDVNVPVGSTVLGAYLYTSMFFDTAAPAPGTTLDGNAVNFTTPLGVATACCQLQAWRSDVTGIVQSIVGGGSAAPFTLTINESDPNQDGEALVVVYSNATTVPATQTVGILDGFSATTGDTATISFGSPLDPTAPGFLAEMRIGDGFSCCNQASTITVNGTTITENAGNNDDGAQVSNGSLITVGSDNDPYSPLLPSYAQDHERYNLTPFITVGDTSITVDTFNPSNDDNIFLEVFIVSGEARIITDVPEPTSLILLSSSLLALGWLNRRRRTKL